MKVECHKHKKKRHSGGKKNSLMAAWDDIHNERSNNNLDKE